ncbi:MAG: GAF domain-containing sensor histidine kinase [Pseudomonadota bacterium]
MNALQVSYHAMLMQSPDPSALLDFDSGLLLDANPRAEGLWGVAREQLLQLPLAQLCPPLQPDGQPSTELLRAEAGRAIEGKPALFGMTCLTAAGAVVPCEVLMIALPVPGRSMLHLRLVDISRRLRAAQLREGQARVLELIARGAPLTAILDHLMLLIESQSDGVLCSVLLLDPDGQTAHPASGPSLPASYMAALDGLQIGPAAGSCGAAMFRNTNIIVPDILADERWEPYRALVVPHGLRACWSTPIAPDQQHVLGSFAMYYREVRSPTKDELHLIDVASHLAGIAIERTRRESELAQHREHLEELVAARTRELTDAVETLSLAQEELVRRDKMAALGALVAGVAHELNTPIGNSLVVATSLAERTRALAASMAEGLRRSELERYLATAVEASELMVRNLKRAATLVAGFKQIAVDHASSERREFDLTELLTDLAAPLRVAAKPAKVRIDLALDPGLRMDSYPGPLSQVVTELFENCIAHAFPGGNGGTVCIGAEIRAGDVVAVTVADNGAGMAADVQARAFDPFFTTRRGAGRSGLGLHVAHNIVSGILGGHIDLHSTPGSGASFTLLLPRAAPPRPDPAHA